MPTTRDRWITAREAAEILTRHSGHHISPDYVRMLSKIGKIDFRARDGRTNEYRYNDVMTYRVRKNYPRGEEKGESSAA